MPAPASRLKTEDGKYNQLGARVKERRKALKLTQDDLAGVLAHLSGGNWNADYQELSRLELGLRMVTDLEILILAKAVKCTPCYLLTGESTAKNE